MLFRENLKALRAELGITQSELARRIGKMPGYICDIERGRLAELTNHEEQEEYRRLSEVVVGWVIEHTQCG